MLLSILKGIAGVTAGVITTAASATASACDYVKPVVCEGAKAVMDLANVAKDTIKAAANSVKR